MASPVNSPPLRASDLTAQTEAPEAVPSCPICHQIDQVRTIQAAFDMGVERIAPPTMPSGNANMAPWIIAGALIYLAGNFYLFIELAINSRSSWPLALQIGSDILSLIALVVGLVLSYLAVVRISRVDDETTERYPAWDQAMETWSHLYYCLRDNVVIDPQQGVLSDTALRTLLSTEKQEPREQHDLLTHGDIHQPAAKEESEPEDMRV